MTAAGPPLVVKLGGSLLASGRLHQFVAIVTGATRPSVVVPGGGPFADAVSTAQARFGFDDRTAHQMALLAMHQMAMLLSALDHRFKIADTLEDIYKAMADGRVPVWQPLQLAGDATDLPADWTVTSDGLTAWLASRLGNAPLVLVKSRRVPADSTAEALADDGIVDPVFVELVADRRLDWRIIGPGDEDALAALLKAS